MAFFTGGTGVVIVCVSYGVGIPGGAPGFGLGRGGGGEGVFESARRVCDIYKQLIDSVLARMSSMPVRKSISDRG